MLSSEVMRQLIKLQRVKRHPGYLATIISGLAAGLIVVPLDAAPQRPAPAPRPGPVTLGAQSSSPPAAAQSLDLRQPGQTGDAAHDDEACRARLRAADIVFDNPAMPVAAKALCAIEIPVRLRSTKTRARTATEVHLTSPASSRSGEQHGSATWWPR